MKRKFTKYPNNYVSASTDTKTYAYKGCKFFVEGDTAVIEDANGYSEYIDELPPKLLSNSEVRKAIYLAYTNFGDTSFDTIYSILQEQASDRTLSLVDKEVG